jgi:hypothetical protein
MRVAHKFRYLFFALIWVSSLVAAPIIWAAPGCVDTDGDGIDKYHRKWCPNGTDPDDNDPCIPNPEATACSGGGGGTGGDTAPDPYNLARASFATRAELAYMVGGNMVEPDGGVFADDKPECEGYDYWDWQEELLPSGVGLPCPTYLNSSNVSGGGRWFLISSPAGSEDVVDEIERWLVVDFSASTDGAPCYDLDNGGSTEDYSDLGIPLYLKTPDDQIAENTDPCVDNLSVRLAADRILKAKANQQQLEFSIRHRPDPEASIYWSPWGYVSYIQPLYLRELSPDDPDDWTGCRVMSTRPAPGAEHDRAEAELLLSTGAGKTELLGSYNLPLEVCVKRASE